MKTQPTTLCLNMIVKNESHIIERLLLSVTPFIDSFCICDTGSTDNTVQIIRSFFSDKNIQGKVIQEPFQDFGYNRSFALNACFDVPNSDYILLLDADMKFQYKFQNLTPIEFKAKLVDDAYFVSQGNDALNYQNIRIIKNRSGFSYWGVTHEYVKSHENCVFGTFQVDELFINDIGDGGSKDDKVERDIRLLTNGLVDNPNNDRYTFYLANSYRDQANYEEAIKYYKKRVEIGGWIEELWFSHYAIGKCYQNMGKIPESIYHWLEAYNRYPKRIENLYEIIKHYRQLCDYNLAYKFYAIADKERKTHTSRNYLFTEMDVYNFKIDYELSIIGYYFNFDNYDLKKICVNVLTHESLEQSKYYNVLSNYKFYTDAIIESSIPISIDNLSLLNSIGKDLVDDTNMISSTPSISFGNDDNELLICVRYINYRIGTEGQYINSKNVTTINVIATIDITFPKWKIKKQSILHYDNTYDDYYIGIEDVRLLRCVSDDMEVSYKYSSNRCNLTGQMKVEHGIIDINTSSSLSSHIMSINGERDIEKNWVLFHHSSFGEKCIYEWYPLTVGDIDVYGKFEPLVKHHNVPSFFKSIRGSTNGVVIGDEIWFICHLVSYEERRYYYHIMVVLDIHSYRLKSYTPLWTFEKQKVEYTLGMVHKNNQFLIGYSTMDNTTKFTNVSKHTFDNMMITHEIILTK
jgi:glycosyltransferase involved in cell wall biosynthesis